MKMSEDSPVWKYVQGQLKLLVLDKIEIHLYNGETSIETLLYMSNTADLTDYVNFENDGDSRIPFNNMFHCLEIRPDSWSKKGGVQVRVRSSERVPWSKHLAAIECYFAPVIADLVEKEYCLKKASDISTILVNLQSRRKKLLELSRGY